MMETGKPADTPKEILRAMRILSAALMIGVLLLTVVMVLVKLVSGTVISGEDTQYKNVFLYMAVGIALLCFTMARINHGKKTAVIKNAAISLNDKLNQYRTVLISYMALCEGGAIFAAIAFFLTGNYMLLIIPALMLAAMFSKMPSSENITNELNLDWKEQQELTG